MSVSRIIRKCFGKRKRSPWLTMINDLRLSPAYRIIREEIGHRSLLGLLTRIPAFLVLTVDFDLSFLACIRVTGLRWVRTSLDCVVSGIFNVLDSFFAFLVAIVALTTLKKSSFRMSIRSDRDG